MFLKCCVHRLWKTGSLFNRSILYVKAVVFFHGLRERYRPAERGENKMDFRKRSSAVAMAVEQLVSPEIFIYILFEIK